MDPYKEQHAEGKVSIENLNIIYEMLQEDQKSKKPTDIGLMVDEFGKIWVCINGVAFLRFKPSTNNVINNGRR